MFRFLKFLAGIAFGAAVYLGVLFALDWGVGILPPPGGSGAGMPRAAAPPPEPEPLGSLTNETVAPPIPPERYTSQYRANLEGLAARQFDFGGRRRQYFTYPAPGAEALADPTPRPTVILFHATGRTGASMIDMWRDVADREGLILIAPNGVDFDWRRDSTSADFVTALIEAARGELPVSPAELYLFGHAAGGGEALRIAALLPGLFVRVAAHAPLLGAGDAALLSRPRQGLPPTLLFSGSADTEVPSDRVQKTALTLSQAGHAVTLVDLVGHTHWFYTIGPQLSARAWAWFRSES